MPPKKTNKTTSLMQFWAKQQAEESARAQRKRPFEPGEVVILGDSQGPEIESSPPPWTPVGRPSFGHNQRPGTSGQRNPATTVSYTKKDDLERLGMDFSAAEFIYHPMDEHIRPYEMQILKKCLSANTCISLPCAICPMQLVGLVFSNFMRWFPRSRCVYCCNSLEAAEHFKSLCVSFGFQESDITIIKTNSDFKKKSEQELGTILIVTPQNILKIVNSDAPLVSEIRCIALCLDQGEQPQKFAKIVGPMVGKGFSFRTLVVIPSVPDGSRSTGSLAKRQQFITSLFISEWEEPTSTDPSFRLGAVPPGIRALYWKTIDLSSEHTELFELWKEGSTPFLEQFSGIVALPSTDLDRLLHVDWSALQKNADTVSPEVAEKCGICEFLATGYRNLLLSGPRVFYLYCAGLLNKSDMNAEKLQLFILEQKKLSLVFEKVQAKYSFNSDSPLNTTYNTLSLYSHVKFRQLSEEVDHYVKSGERVQGVVLCESNEVARVACESLSYIPSCHVILAVGSKVEIPANYRNHCRNVNRMAGIFFQNKGVVVVMSFEDEAAFGALDTVSSNGLHFIISTGRRSVCMADIHSGDYVALLSYTWEQLRPSDGRVPDSVAESQIRRSSLGLVGVVNKYDFKYEPSRLSIDIRRKRVSFITTAQAARKERSGGGEAVPTTRQGFELTGAEFAEYSRRVGKEAELPKKGIFVRRGLRILNSPVTPMSREHLLWHKVCYKPSSVEGDLSRRFVNYLSDRPVVSAKKPMKKKKYEYDNYENTPVIQKYDLLITKLDRLLSM